MIMTSPNFLRVMGIPVEEGRDFSLSDELSEEPVYIFNETAKLAVNMEQGDILQSWIPGRIIGFTGNVKFTLFATVRTILLLWCQRCLIRCLYLIFV